MSSEVEDEAMGTGSSNHLSRGCWRERLVGLTLSFDVKSKRASVFL
jgi:hypothetical protein